MKDIKNKLLDTVKSSHFGPLDVVTLEIKHESFTPKGVIKCSESIKAASESLFRCMKKCKHPGLNPFVDEMIKYKEGSKDGHEIIYKFLENEAKFSYENIDNNSSYTSIQIKLDILFANLEGFVLEEEFTISSAKIQGPLHSEDFFTD